MMSRKQLLNEVWSEEIRDEILSCIVMQVEDVLRPTCAECELYPICKKVIEYEKEEAK